jgi:hypothetical protein
MPDPTLARIRAENLGVYRASRNRLKEDVSQEDEVSADYRGRLLYELLQNADDAMSGAATSSDRITFRLTDSDLWVGNSGRPLSEEDVEGLCGLGASSKGDAGGRRRASIGHKGMGFKSVLEITASPQAFSEDHSFRLGADLAYHEVAAVLAERGDPPPRKVPAMRFPYPIEQTTEYWDELRTDGIRTLFRFPLRRDLTAEVREELAGRLLSFPPTSILFLKHLECVDIEIERGGSREVRSWRLKREHRSDDRWAPCTGLDTTGLYRVSISSGDRAATFVVAHDADVEIGQHRGGLTAQAWKGVELSEVSVAARVDAGHPVPVQEDWRVFHVFLPTSEACPYPLLVNGAFASDISRRDIRVAPDRDDYNRHLLCQVARVFRDELVPGLRRIGAATAEILQLLARDAEPGEPCDREAAQALYEAMRSALADHPFMPLEGHEGSLHLRECAVPPLVADAELGRDLHDLLGSAPRFGALRLPSRELCSTRHARIAVDHGATAIAPDEVPGLIAAGDLETVRLVEHESGGFYIDPVLSILERLWASLDPWARESFAHAVRAQPLFPVGEVDGVIKRLTTEGRACFYPPRTLKASVPLANLSFLMQDVCWGALTPTERTDALSDQMAAWQGLFEVREFKFPDVMRASVLPALTLEVDPDDALRQSLCHVEALAAICQLSGRTPNPAAPLPYERLGPNRALFNLARLPVPCRGRDGRDIEWHPAYTVYFGEDWIPGEESVERVLRSLAESGQTVPDVPLLVEPPRLVGQLVGFSHLHDENQEPDATTDEGEDEVDINEDEEETLDTDEHERWLRFLTWLGVNRGLRPVPFHDVEDRSSGWLTTKGLSRPVGRAFARVPQDVWTTYRTELHAALSQLGASSSKAPYFYRLHDLEHAPALLDAAAADETNRVGRALFEHLSSNWPRLQRFTRSQLAMVPADLNPSRRTKPPRAKQQELVDVGDDFWLWRLRGRDFCPTTHGPREPRRVWLRTPEVERRFGRLGSDPALLLPLLEVSTSLRPGIADGIARALGVRPELTPASFQADDARLLLERLKVAWSQFAPHDRERTLRQVIRPAYRNLIELLPSSDDQARPGYPDNVLRGAPLLVQNGGGEYRFEPSDRVLWAERSGTQDRLGRPPELWTFVLGAETGARTPLTRLLGVRVLEEQLVWQAEPGEPALAPESLAAFRSGLAELAPYLLARLAAERADERRRLRDAGRLREFVNVVEPVTDLIVRCQLDGRDTAAGMTRAAFGLPRGDEMQAFVVWGENAWPPDTAESERLAQALCDCLEVPAFEAFHTLLTASSDESRVRLLELAGAPTDLAATREAFLGGTTEAPTSPAEPPLIPKTPGERTGEESPAPPTGVGSGEQPAVPKTPLYAPDQLIVSGAPLELEGSGAPRPKGGTRGRREPPKNGGGQNGGGRYGGRTNLSELDSVGMHVTLTFERERLRREGIHDPAIFVPEQPDTNALVYDVSTLEAIEAAKKSSPRFRRALAFLQRQGLNAEAPGFDVLTLKPHGPDGSVNRLIELKSSGVRSRTQEMTWNEWKSARNSELRRMFYLYLVGNLRRDLPDAAPFLRAIRDPFGTLWAEEREERSTARKVRLDLDGFTVADEEKLGVRADPPLRREGHEKANPVPSAQFDD